MADGLSFTISETEGQKAPPLPVQEPVGNIMDGRVFMMKAGGFGAIETSDNFEPSQETDALDNIRANGKHKLPYLRYREPRPETLLIVGGGPSLLKTFPTLKEKIAAGGKVFAVNDTHDWLIKRGILPDYMGCIEVAPWPRGKFCTLANDHTEYLLASIGHPTIIEHVLGKKITVYHPWCGIGEDPVINEFDHGGVIVYGAEAISIRALNLGKILGFSKFEMFGVDGSFQDNMPSHAYFDEKHKWPVVNFFCAGRSFRSTFYLARQVDDLRRVLALCDVLRDLKTHGDGMLQHMHRTLYPNQYQDEKEEMAA